MNLRRSAVSAALLCALGGLVVFFTSGRQWAHTTVPSAVAGAGGTDLSVTGHQAAATLPATGIALVALAAAILAASGVLRRIVGGVVVLMGVAAIGAAINGRGDVSSALRDREAFRGAAVHAAANGWWIVALAGGILAVAAGVVTATQSQHWSRMNEKYDAPAAPRPTSDPAAVAWDALDRGEDPTA